MRQPTRREVLRAGSALSVGAFAGCIAGSGGSNVNPSERFDADPSKQSDTDPAKQSTTESPKKTDETTGATSSLTDWERSTDCEGEHDRMHDSVVEVERVATSVDDDYAPIAFSSCTPGERDILRTVTEDGGYGTCDPSDAFHRFVERVIDHTERQTEDRHVYLEREGTYYGLYVEVSDQVYAY